MSHETFQAPEPEQLAKLLPAYDFQGFIAQGGMGAVYKAVQRSLDRDVAIKILPPAFGSDPEFRASFETEAKAMAKANHPNLIAVYDFGAVDGMPFIVMEYVDGKSLYHSSWGKTIDPVDACRIVKGICDGLAHAHEAGVIHRDIKPANILLNQKAEPKIGDFGLAQAIDQEGPGLLMGTPGYAAPEILDEQATSDHRADLYAVGVILHELVTGERADGSHPPSKATGNLKLDAIWRKATQPDPARRYQDAAAMSQALDGWLRSAGTRQTPRKLVINPTAPATKIVRPQPAAANPVRRVNPTRPVTPARPVTSGQPGTAAAHPAPAGPPRTPPPGEAAGYWSIGRSLLIIAALVGAIFITHKVLTVTRANRVAEIERSEREHAEAREKAEQEQRKARAESSGPAVPPVVEEPGETPMEALARLRADLRAGERGELPPGTSRRGDSDYFRVPEPMGWHRAAAFAEDHGGHLALAESESAVIWLSEFLPRNEAAWIGAGRSSGNRWVHLDGRPWSLGQQPSGVGDFVSVNSLGLLRTRGAADELPFIIQWRRDGSNPAGLAAMLRRTRETLGNPAPVFPIGTRSFDGRHFAIITRAVDRTGAERLAAQAGGHLAVPASRDECDWLADETEEFDAPDGLWLGGRRRDGAWTWTTGEPWDHERWLDNRAPEDRHDSLVLLPGGDWVDAPANRKSSGFIIEWSRDGERSASRDEAIGEIDGTLAELNQRAAELITEARKKRAERLESNVETFLWDLNVWSRSLNSNDTARWTPHLEALKAMVDGNRLPGPDDFGAGSEIELSEKMARIADYGFTKQKEIEAEYLDSLGRLREAYVERLKAAGREAREAGKDTTVKTLADAVETATGGDVETWAGEMLEGRP
jgi:predicted Ser/Thr protein kinase